MKATATANKIRDAVLIVEAAKGFKRQAYSLIRRAITKSGLTVTAFISESEGRVYGPQYSARFIITCDDSQLDAFLTVGSALAVAEGWERFPVDVYHD